MIVGWVITFLSIVTVSTILILVKKNLMHPSYSIFWVFISILILILGLFPEINIKIASFLGVKYSPILPVVTAIMVIFIKTLKQDIELTKKEKQIKRLTQELAIIKLKIKNKKII
jgi:hypothetical protein